MRARYSTKKGKSFFPLDDRLKLGRIKSSKGFAKVATQLAIFVPEEHTRDFLKTLLNIDVSVTLISNIVTRFGSKLHSDYYKKSRRTYAIENKETNVDVLYVEADGAMTPLWGDKCREYKENKLGIVFNNKDIVHKITKNDHETCKVIHKKFVSSIAEGVEPFKKMLFAAAVEKGYHSAKKIVFLCDGASWLMKLRDEYFPNAIQILDWYHAVEHLWETGEKLFEGNKDKMKQWAEPLQELLWNGKVKDVIKLIEKQALGSTKYQTELYKLRGYYVSHSNFMKYDKYREQGLFIGSGIIESANKYIVSQRLKQSGMIWSKVGADSMIWARCKYFEGYWDDFWDTVNMQEYFKSNSIKMKKIA